MHILVHHTQLVDMHGMACWVQHREFQPDDAPPYHLGWVTPLDMFETIAAELDIDPDEPGAWDTLLDIELYRAVLPHYDDHADGSWLYDAPSIKHARETHLARIAEAKGNGRARGVPGVTPENRRVAAQTNPPMLDSGAEDPLEVMKRHSPMSRPHIEVKRAHRDMHREGARMRRLQRQRATASGVPPRETPEELRARLQGPSTTPRGNHLGAPE